MNGFLASIKGRKILHQLSNLHLLLLENYAP